MDDKVPGIRFNRNMNANNRFGEMKLFCGSAANGLGSEIASYLSGKAGYEHVRPGYYDRKVFSNGNIFIRLRESVRGKDVYLVQTMAAPIHETIFELFIMIDTLKRDSAWRINVVIPYMTYTRSDKKDQPRVPITARMMANFIEVAGADRYMSIDLHSGQIQGFFNIPGDALSAFYLLSDYVAEKQIPNLVVVATDLGFAKQGRNWGERLNVPTALIEKRRIDNNERPMALSLIGDVKGKNVLMVDDEVNTAGSIVNAVNVVRENGAKDVYVAFTHAMMTEDAYERLIALHLAEIICTNTLPVPDHIRPDNMTVLSVAPMLAEVILRAHEGRSVGELFNE
jgi:ribose-phosphate pyrophosphokinase